MTAMVAMTESANRVCLKNPIDQNCWLAAHKEAVKDSFSGFFAIKILREDSNPNWFYVGQMIIINSSACKSRLQPWRNVDDANTWGMRKDPIMHLSEADQDWVVRKMLDLFQSKTELDILCEINFIHRIYREKLRLTH